MIRITCELGRAEAHATDDVGCWRLDVSLGDDGRGVDRALMWALERSKYEALHAC